MSAFHRYKLPAAIVVALQLLAGCGQERQKHLGPDTSVGAALSPEAKSHVGAPSEVVEAEEVRSLKQITMLDGAPALSTCVGPKWLGDSVFAEWVEADTVEVAAESFAPYSEQIGLKLPGQPNAITVELDEQRPNFRKRYLVKDGWLCFEFREKHSGNWFPYAIDTVWNRKIGIPNDRLYIGPANLYVRWWRKSDRLDPGGEPKQVSRSRTLTIFAGDELRDNFARLGSVIANDAATALLSQRNKRPIGRIKKLEVELPPRFAIVGRDGVDYHLRFGAEDLFWGWPSQCNADVEAPARVRWRRSGLGFVLSLMPIRAAEIKIDWNPIECPVHPFGHLVWLLNNLYEPVFAGKDVLDFVLGVERKITQEFQLAIASEWQTIPVGAVFEGVFRQRVSDLYFENETLKATVQYVVTYRIVPGTGA
jgi:hypothetical protein